MLFAAGLVVVVVVFGPRAKFSPSSVATVTSVPLERAVESLDAVVRGAGAPETLRDKQVSCVSD